MRRSLIVLFVIGLLGCGSGFRFAAQSEASTVSPTPPSTPSSKLSSGQAGSVAGFVNGIVSQVISQIQVSGAFNLNLTSVDGDVSLPCPGGGTVTVSIQAGYSLSLGLSINADLTNGSGALQFNSCIIPASEAPIEISGSVSLADLAGSLTGSLNLEGSGQATIQDGLQATGTLSVVAGAFSANCEMQLIYSGSGSAAITLAPSLSGSLISNSQLQFCGLSSSAENSLSL